MAGDDPRESPAPDRLRVAVVGGGIAGLTAARDVLLGVPDAAVTVYEAARDIGGKLRVGELAGGAVDEGAEAMLYRRPEATELARAVGLEDRLVHPIVTSAAIWTRGALRALPPGLLGIPGDVGQAVRAGVLSRPAGVRARVEPWLGRESLEQDIAVGRLVARRLGGSVRDRIVEPLLGGVYAGHADSLSTFAAAPQIARGLREHGSLLGAAADAVRRGTRVDTPLFAGLVGGVGTLARAVASDVERRGGRIRCGTTVREMRPADTDRRGGGVGGKHAVFPATTATSPGGRFGPGHPHGWQLTIGSASQPEHVIVDAVILACPAAPAGRLLREAAPAAGAELAAIEYASMAVVLLAFDRADIGEQLTGSGFLVPPVDGRTVKAATFSSHKWGWMADGAVVVRCSVGRHGEEYVLQRDDAELVDAASVDLSEATGLRSRPVDARVVRWGGALPQYAVGHLDRIGRIRRAVDALPGLAVCGAAYDGLGIPACITSAHEAVTRTVDVVRAPETMRP